MPWASAGDFSPPLYGNVVTDYWCCRRVPYARLAASMRGKGKRCCRTPATSTLGALISPPTYMKAVFVSGSHVHEALTITFPTGIKDDERLLWRLELRVYRRVSLRNNPHGGM